MSDYFAMPCESLLSRKATAVGLEDSVDPYSVSNSSKFTDDLALRPADEYGHILGAYFIAEQGLHMHIQVQAWKQLVAYNYFQSCIHITLTKSGRFIQVH